MTDRTMFNGLTEAETCVSASVAGLTTATKAGGAVLPDFWEEVCEACPGWHSLHEKGLLMNEAALVRVGTAFTAAQATIDELRAEVERLRKVACAAIEARRRYGWSVEADAAIEALRASLLGDGGTL